MLCLILGVQSYGVSCDACGCLPGNMGFGLLTDYKVNYFRVSYFSSRFNSSTEHDHHNSSDRFQLIDLSFRFSVKDFPRINFYGQLPYKFNDRMSGDKSNKISGLSDVSLGANYTLIKNRQLSSNSQLYLEAGIGLSMPTGKYDGDILNQNLPENFNLGRGSFGYITQLNSVLNFKHFGVLWNNNLQINGKTNEGYLFGKQYSTQLNAFKELDTKHVQIIPNFGLLYEQISRDKSADNYYVSETGGKGLFANVSLNFKTNSWLAGISISQPLAENYSSGVIEAKGRAAIHFSILF